MMKNKRTYRNHGFAFVTPWCLFVLVLFACCGMMEFSFAANESAIPSERLRGYGMHNTGQWTLLMGTGRFPIPAFSGYSDPETRVSVQTGSFLEAQQVRSIYNAGILIGGVVGDDTLVSHSFDLARYATNEFQPEFPDSGGTIRTGGFADDEFMTVYTDTVTNPAYIGQPNPYDDTTHIPMGLRVVQRSYSWTDTLYKNIVIVEVTIENIQSSAITDCWAAVYMDPDMYCTAPGGNAVNGYADDFTGCLDTLLYDDDPSSRVLIPYATDNDGDPDFTSNFVWDAYSARHAVSFGILYTSVPDPTFNYNWWLFDVNNQNYGPRRLGTPEDPFRIFVDSSIGAPARQEDVYYTMSHPEVDFDQISVATIDSSSGWLPAAAPVGLTDHDTRFMFSIGPFDLLPGDTQKVVYAIIGTENFHRNAADYYNLFNAEAPDAFVSTLDFPAIVRNHRRADSLYQSGFTLPRPGPPVGLEITSFDENKIHLNWNKKGDPNIVGYYVNVRIPEYYDVWHHAHTDMLEDTTFDFPITNPAMEIYFAVTAVDNQGRESLRSFWTSCVTGTPQPPVNVQMETDGWTPLITWESPCDTCLYAYYIYRSTDGAAFVLYDSTAALAYRDHNVQSGIYYRYYVKTVTAAGVLSEPSSEVQILPVALEHKVLFFDLNSNPTVSLDAFRPEYIADLLSSVESTIDIEYVHIDQTPITLSLLSQYEVVVFDKEKEGGKFEAETLDEISLYLQFGGKALFIVPNTTTYTISRQLMQMGRYGDGQYFHDIFHLDSALANKMVFAAGALYGDLLECESHHGDYPTLTADSAKLVLSTVPNEGGIPLAGCLFPIPGDVDTLYSYVSLYPDSLLHQQVNGIRYANEDYAFILFNFPLSLMEAPGNYLAFRQALRDLGFNLTCGDYNDDGVINIGDVISFISFLYRGGEAPPDTWRADVDCDGGVALGDALVLINQIFRGGPAPVCCPPGE
ncbi:MAG: dockerin type I domain-containing protein [Candidatus Zixiibacteriota bacterium]